MSDSSSGGYLQPAPQQAFPGGLSLSEFIQTVLVGVSGLQGKMVRPRWQPEPPKDPDLYINWLAYGINTTTPDNNAYVGVAADGSNVTARHERIEVGVSFYGPQAQENSDLLRDGFQIQQNLAALLGVKMNFIDYGASSHVPDLVNERWINRVDATVTFTRMIQRVYPILTFLTANGTITAQNQGGLNTVITFNTGS